MFTTKSPTAALSYVQISAHLFLKTLVKTFKNPVNSLKLSLSSSYMPTDLCIQTLWLNRDTVKCHLSVYEETAAFFAQTAVCLIRDIQRSWCQRWGWRCTGDVIGLYLAFLPQHTLGESKQKRSVRYPVSLSLGWNEEEKEEEYPVTAGSNERGDRSVYLGKLIDWEERWWGERGRKVVEGARRGGLAGYWSCDCSCHNLRYASVLLLHRNAKQDSFL